MSVIEGASPKENDSHAHLVQNTFDAVVPITPTLPGWALRMGMRETRRLTHTSSLGPNARPDLNLPAVPGATRIL